MRKLWIPLLSGIMIATTAAPYAVLANAPGTGTYALNECAECLSSLLVYPGAPAETPPNYVDESIVHDPSKWTTNNTHDAEIIKVGDWYYAFSTDYKVGGTPEPGIPVRKSPDLINWTYVGQAFESVTPEAKAWTGNDIFWAPDVVEMNGKFYMYYSVSGIGSRNSYIGLATSDNIEGPWTDEGAVFKTQDNDDYTVNAIDANIVFDAQGEPWMVYGSYFGGMFITKLDKTTGKLQNEGDEGTLLAKRRPDSVTGPGPGIEGPNMIYNAETGYYYLTVSYEWLEDKYNVRVARSQSITGPFVDYNGRSMIDTTASADTGTKIVSSYAFEGDPGWLGTAHNALLQDGDNYYIAHNARAGANKFWSHLHVRKILWTEDGWPVASPERYAGEQEQAVSAEQLVGDWEQIVLDRTDDTKRTSSIVALKANGRIGSEDSPNVWTLTGDNTLTLKWYAPGVAPGDYWIDTLKVIPAWDWEKWRPTLVSTGLNQFGTAIWGKQLEPLDDAGSVAAAKENLSLSAGELVFKNLILPTVGSRSTTITWESSRPEVLSTNGTVVRPAAGSGNAQVTLTATITKGAAVDTKVFNVTVKQLGTELAAKYTFDSADSLSADSTANALDATVFGATYDANGKFGGAVSLDGADDYLQLSNEVTDAADFTVTGWVYWRGGGSWQRIIDFGGGGGHMFFTPKGREGTLQFAHYQGVDQELYGGVFPENQWTHVAVTLQGDTGKLYVNGELVDTNEAMTYDPIDLLANSNYVGKSRFADPTFNGSLDDLEILRKALTQEEIQQRMLGPVSSGGGDNSSGGGDNSSGGGGSSSGSTGGSASTTPSNPARMVVNAAALAETAAGIASIQIAKGTSEVALPTALLQDFKGKAIELVKDQGTLTLSKSQLEQLLKQASAASLAGGQIIVSFNPADSAAAPALTAAQGQTGASITAAGGIYELNLQLAGTAGQTVPVEFGTAGIELTLNTIGKGLESLQNVYAIGKDGSLTYIPGKSANGRITITINKPGTYGVLEYSKSFADVPDSHWAEQTVSIMAAKQIVQGVTADEFQPSREINRAEFAVVLARALGLKSTGTPTFLDVPQGAWYADGIAALQEAGLISGRADGQFAPEETITREEAAVLIHRAKSVAIGSGSSTAAVTVPFQDADSISAWAQDAVESAAQAGLLNGRENGTFAPQANITRAESMQLLLNLLTIQE